MVEIQILDSANNLQGSLDLAKFDDFPLAITKSIATIDNLKQRKGDYSKTFKVPATKNNNELLGHIYNINRRKDTNSVLSKKQCRILVDNIEREKGFIKVQNVNSFDSASYYELVFFGNSIDWVDEARDLSLQSVNWRENTTTYDEATIKAVNSGGIATYDYAYPVINRGQYSGDKVAVEDFRPCLYANRIVNTGLEQLGFTVVSNFINGNKFKNLICDMSPRMRRTDLERDSTKVRASYSSDVDVFVGNVTTAETLVFDDDSTGTNEDDFGRYETNNGQYQISLDGKYSFKVNVSIATNYTQSVDATIRMYRTRGGNTTEVDNYSYQVTGFNVGTIQYTFDSTTFEANDIVYFTIEPNVTPTNPIGTGGWTILSENGFQQLPTYLEVIILENIDVGDTYDVSYVLPDIKLMDVISDFILLFNLYVWTDVRTKKIYIEPRDDFFKGTGSAIDWSDKLALDREYQINYVSSYKNKLVFKYKEDSADGWVDTWQEINDRIYGEYEHNFGDRFLKGSTVLETSVFSPTYPIQDVASSPDGINAGDSMITSRIWKEFVGDEEGTDVIEKYNPRILNFDRTTQDGSFLPDRQARIFGVTEETLPFAIFEPYGTLSGNDFNDFINLNFAGSTGLFNTYYSKTITNIENGAKLIAYFNLTANDVANFDFRKLVYLNHPQLRGYYIVEEIKDFQYINKGLTKVSLIRFEAFEPATLDSNQTGANDPLNDIYTDPPTEGQVYIVQQLNGIDIEIDVYAEEFGITKDVYAE